MKNKLLDQLFVGVVIFFLVLFSPILIFQFLLKVGLFKSYKNLKSKDISKIRDNFLVLAVMDWMHHYLEVQLNSDFYGYVEVQKVLSDKQMTLYLTNTLDLNNIESSLEGLFVHTDNEEIKHGIDAFEKISAIEWSEFYRKVFVLFEETRPLILMKGQFELKESFNKLNELFMDEKTIKSRFEELNDEFYEVADREELYQLQINYIRENASSFGNE